jgi:MFS family permease
VAPCCGGRFVDSGAVLERLGVIDNRRRRWIAAGLGVVLVTAPLWGSGPGNDLDVANVFRSGRSIARHGTYRPSRAPGAPVHEALVGVADLVGGTVLTNLVSLVAAGFLLWGLDRLLRREGAGPGARWAVGLVAANPWFVVATTSSTDYVLALALAVGAANALREGRAGWAGILAALAMGTRVGSVTLVAAALVAHATEPVRDPTRRSGDQARSEVGTRRRDLAVTALTAVLGIVVMFVPSAVQAGGLAFAENDFSTSSLTVQIGRAAVKDLTLLGVIGSVLALATLPAVIKALGRWRTSWLVRFAGLGLVLSQLLFIRFPWKLPHLLPTLICGAILLATALGHRARPTLLMALVAVQILYGVVQVDVIRPDDPDQATGATFILDVSWGPVITDLRCRRQHPDPHLGRQKVEVEAAWNCSQPFGAQ